MDSRVQRFRPLVGGISIGHKNTTAGTLGCFVEDINGKIYILSCNHVLANENDAKIEDEILQPAPSDNGKIPDDVVGKLSKFIEIKFPESSCLLSNIIVKTLNFTSKILGRKTRFKIYSTEYPQNEVDCAIAEPTVEINNEILEIGKPKGSARVKEGEKVMKSGRTTGLTEGEVISESADVKVWYSKGQALFVNQILVRTNVQGGDSGSVLVNKDGYVVGLIFAGTEDGSIGIANHIYKVEEALGVKVCTM
jgi:S1-C subfamily serine protease